MASCCFQVFPADGRNCTNLFCLLEFAVSVPDVVPHLDIRFISPNKQQDGCRPLKVQLLLKCLRIKIFF